MDEKIQNTHAYYVQIQFVTYTLKVQYTMKRVTTKKIILLENPLVVNVKRLMIHVMLLLQ